ncbi:MAG: serine hydrolase [Clostridia bacterium]|nr:serine hydrolase [Clostridia bacterium]
MADKKDPKALQHAQFPEQVGVSSAELKRLIEDFDAQEIELHSLMVLREGKVALECYRAPYNHDTPHTMYSVSKSFTSVAIGFAVDEGLLSLDTKVIDMFPEYRPKKPDPLLEAMTVRHLLTMTSGKDISVITDKTRGNWVKDFFKAKWGFAPGEGWKYVSENTYICCAIIYRLTGQHVLEYLQPRLLVPLGIDRMPFWEHDPDGLEAGGWGLFVTTEELARFMLCVAQGGVYAGQQVIPAWYAAEAVAKQVENEHPEALADSHWGYGYYFWRNALENSYRADGMFSQFGIVFEDYNAVVVMTASEVDEQKSRDCLFRHFPAAFIEKSRKKPEDAVPVKELTLSPMEPLPALPHSVLEEFIKGKVIKLNRNPLLNAAGWPLSMLPIAIVYMSADRGGNINNLVLDFGEDTCTLAWDEGKTHNVILCGMDGSCRESRIHVAGIDFTAVSSAAWIAPDSLELRMRPLESISERRLTLVFKGNNVTVFPECSPPISQLADNLKTTVTTSISSPLLSKGGAIALKQLEKIIDMPLLGTMKQ